MGLEQVRKRWMEEDQMEVTGHKCKKGRLAVRKISPETHETKRPLIAVHSIYSLIENQAQHF